MVVFAAVGVLDPSLAVVRSNGVSSVVSACDDARDRASTVGLLGGESIVRAAEQSNVEGVVVSAQPMRMNVIVFEPRAAVAADAVGASPGASRLVTSQDGAPAIMGDVSAVLRWLLLRCGHARR